MLGIFAKAPVPGRVKTRLAAAVGPERAARWYARAVGTVFRRTRAAWPDVERVLFYDPPDAEATFAHMPDVPAHRRAQRGPDLGARMAAALEYCLAAGAERPVLIGTDAPTMPMARLGDAWTALGSHDVVLGPTADGGYYLIGLRHLEPALFADIAWSTDRVLTATLARAAKLGCSVAQLEPWFDVDTADDLVRLGADWDA